MKNNLKITFYDLFDEWLNYKRTKVKESTYFNYSFVVNECLKKYFENVNLEEVGAIDFYSIIDRLSQQVSKKTLRDRISILKSILKYGERKYDMDFKVDLINMPTIYNKEIEVLTEREKNRITNYLLETENVRELGILISLYTGLRIGEVCALKWKNIDFEKKLIEVEKTVQRVYMGEKDTKLIFSEPKTVKSIRKIPIAEVLLKKLKETRRFYPKDAFILTGTETRFMEPITYRFTYKKCLRNCRVTYKKFHCLRHNFATRCIRAGMDVKSLSEVLGHNNVNVTLSIYVHSSYKVKKKYIDKI